MPRSNILFIQFAGFTFGKSSSAYSTPVERLSGQHHLQPARRQQHRHRREQHPVHRPVRQWRVRPASVSTIRRCWDRTIVANLITSVERDRFGASNAYAATHAPDVVGNIRVDQAWGLFQISAAAHEVNGSYNVLNTVALRLALPACRCGSDRAVGNLRSSRDQVGRFGDGGVADQEHPDRSRRRHQDATRPGPRATSRT